MARTRLDKLVLERGIAPTREKAQALILAGQIHVNGQPATKAGALVAADARVELVGEPPHYVSRGGFKLEGALRDFSLDVRGQTCLDVGASTGGFTDCLLQHGAARVYA
ncbi:MAG: SAM-dependent methyltransferase, partial [Candidatus Acidiferrales bacterium]